jgi:hypothetical protein
MSEKIQQIKYIVFRNNEATSFHSIKEVERPDVAKAYSEDSLKMTGFETLIDIKPHLSSMEYWHIDVAFLIEEKFLIVPCASISRNDLVNAAKNVVNTPKICMSFRKGSWGWHMTKPLRVLYNAVNTPKICMSFRKGSWGWHMTKPLRVLHDFLGNILWR